MSPDERGAGRAADPASALGPTGALERLLTLVLAGLVRDEDELLGDLAEARAGVAASRGERAARRWWWGQALRAVPRLGWHDLVHRPAMALLGLAGFVGWVALTSVAYTASWFPTVNQSYDMAHPVLPRLSDVIVATTAAGVWNLLAAALVGAGTALLARRARLVPGLVSAALMALISARHAFYIVYGPGTCATSPDGSVETCSLELGAWSDDVVVPVLWQLPTMMILLPVATVLGGLAVVARVRAHRARGQAAPPR
ncbi:hypothetical protein OEB99_15895 [Actinotalea sp. M2MS4P-6]|uniref:hypothetical protein n=1 Tax=Actinotalea sp. M2MS4P-6 TaxID=2983762 RepID=UPI0021E398E4|nr:hypothetical protein [Actinotalea sp. M2MS4P-6]MCV2395798.1 hypothetical protein [Actinotalea sp. M2MS4P-6]